MDVGNQRPVVLGIGVDGESRCAHWRSSVDVVAMRFKCCGAFYGCAGCHVAVAGHAPERWDVRRDRDEIVAMCGVCGTQYPLKGYLANGDACSTCGADWNPGCRKHRELYFKVGLTGAPAAAPREPCRTGDGFAAGGTPAFSAQNGQSVTAFRQNATETLDRLARTGEAEVLTVDGEARAVLLSPAAYDAMVREARLSGAGGKHAEAGEASKGGERNDGAGERSEGLGRSRRRR